MIILDHKSVFVRIRRAITILSLLVAAVAALQSQYIVNQTASTGHIDYILHAQAN